MHQIDLQESYSRTTMDIQVTVIPEFMPDQSSPDEGTYAYSYTVDIENLSSKTVQLKNRHWLVFATNGQIADIKGEGGIGEQPFLGPNETFRYTSWTMIPAAIGSMKGSYTFLSDDGHFFDVEIPEFMLVYVDPETIH